MARKSYEIEIMFATGSVRTLDRSFATQKAAREWCGRNGMEPLFGGKRPGIFVNDGMTATIREAGSPLWMKSSTEGRAARRIAEICTA